MGQYREHLLPRLVDRACGSAAFARWRAETASGLSGDVLEIGFGSGHNVGYYPPEVRRVLAVEPSATAWRLAARRIARSPVPVDQVGLDGQRLPLLPASCDHALCTFTLCTVDDPAAALAEVRRVLRPGGRLHVLEHGLAPEPRVATWQRRLEPLQRRVAGGCHLTRDPLSLLRQAGFAVEESTQAYGSGPRPWTYLYRVVATWA